jgi:hypothetical protein
MMKKALSVFIIFLLIPFVFSQEACGPSDTPKIIASSLYSANVNSFFFADVNSSNTKDKISFSLIPIITNIKNLGINKDTGIIAFTPNKSNAGVSTFLVIAVTEKGCYDTRKMGIVVYDKPQFTTMIPDIETIELNQTRFVRFYVNASSSSPPLSYQWFKDNALVAVGNTYTYITNYSDSGIHLVKAFAKDSRGLNSSVQWILVVKHKNRGPYIKYYFPNLALTTKKDVALLNVYDYIYDPDYDRLNFEPIFMDIYQSKKTSTSSPYFEMSFDSQGYMYVKWESVPPKEQGVMIKATDTSNESVLSLPFYLKVAVEENYTYYLLNGTENVTPDCRVEIICRGWSECLPTGIKTRDCYDYRNCNRQNTTFSEYEKCEYKASCYDRIKNQNEENIDCGGVCKLCESCNDGIKNQGESDTDCGGPCKPCPSCEDSVKNQDETDIDCGGICGQCGPGMKCTQHNECQSLLCNSGICAAPSCKDSRKNQGETNIDCGGPCEPCQTCFDKIKNQNEEGIDCGGQCKPCETCFDKKRNQGELLIDCGGPCESCKFGFIFATFKNLLIIIGIIILPIFVYLMIKSKYENDKIEFLVTFSSMLKYMPKKLPNNYNQLFSKVKFELETHKQDIISKEEKSISEAYLNTINNFYSSLFEVEGIFGESLLRHSINSHINNPFLANLFLEAYLQSTSISPGKPFFKVELEEKIIEFLKILTKIEEML